MTFIDLYHNKDSDTIHVVERDKTGKRIFKDFKPEYSFYYSDPKGSYKSIYGESCSLFTTHSQKLFRKELNKLGQYLNIFESDVKPIFKLLEKHYKNSEPPSLNISFFDIEVDFHYEKGFAYPDDPFNEITAISLYNKWEDICYTLVKAPNTFTQERAEKICKEFSNTHLCNSEEELLRIFLELIEDTDILSGWNSATYDIPYIIGRIIRVLGGDYARKLCHWNLMPKSRTFLRYEKEHLTYDLFGRIHLDYLDLYRKYTYHELHSYSLDNVGDVELKESKIAYEGSLDDLYKKDFRKFIEYNRQDTMLLHKIDEKNKFIDLINTMAHENCTLLPKTMGAVNLTDSAIILEAHEKGFVIPNRNKNIEEEDEWYSDIEDTEEEIMIKHTKTSPSEIMEFLNNRIAGAYVANPKIGLTPWVGSVDITSLYPSIIMAMNISPETLEGQIDQSETRKMLYDKIVAGYGFADAWSGHFMTLEAKKVFENSKEKVTVTLEEARKPTKTFNVPAHEVNQFIFNNKRCLTANGTIFRYDIDGIIPELINKWFKDRKTMQTKAKQFEELLEKETNKKQKEKYKKQHNYWDKRQLIKKIQLNSLYGALTNEGSHFHDQRMGQSITLTGRCITRHMAAAINEILTGEYDYKGKCIQSGDTDSAYFSAWPIRDILAEQNFEFTEDSVVELYDNVADTVNVTFKDFMMKQFNCHPERAKKIKANREICSRATLFVKKKRYAALVYDKEGFKFPNGKLKIMGMDTQRADTPTYVQNFLKDVLRKTLSNEPEENILEFIKEFRIKFKSQEPWLMGTPKRCNGLSKYSDLENKIPNSNLPGHIRAAYNWNKLKKALGDHHSMIVPDGGKTIVCRLKDNQFGIKSIAYPIDQKHLPDWFKNLPFDVDTMEYTLIDKKLNNLIGLMNFHIEKTKQNENVSSLFGFS